ncbi:MAG TPA: cell division protein FtsA [Patescibacteria group bacterium]|nr:cell division protein FtsA [Patescibacteria group bacterium]
MSSQGELIAGLDIGSTKIRMAVGQLSYAQHQSEPTLNIIGAFEVPAQGINKGVITSIEDAVVSITKCLENIERTVGHSIEQAWVGISGSHIICQESKGVVAVSRHDGEIDEGDVERAVEAARTVATPSNYEILHVIPRSFTIDGQANIKDPVGMTGIRLEVDSLIIQGLSSQIKNLTKCVYRTGLDIEDLVLSILAASQSVLNSRQKDLGVVMIDIGGTTTSMIVIEEGDVVHTAVLPIGSDHITSDIAIGLRISIDAAEKIKLKYGTALSKQVDKQEVIQYKEIDISEDGEVPKKYVAEIIEARVEEIFKKIDTELERVNRSGMLPAGAVFVGGGSKLPGIIDLAKRRLRLPAMLGRAQNVLSAVDKTQDLSYMTSIGLIVWGEQMLRQKRSGKFSISRFKSVVDVTDKMRKWFKSLIP